MDVMIFTDLYDATDRPKLLSNNQSVRFSYPLACLSIHPGFLSDKTDDGNFHHLTYEIVSAVLPPTG